MANAKLIDSIPNDECLTIDDIAEEFGTGPLRARQIVEKAIKSGNVPRLVKKDGRRYLYAPQMMEALRKAKDKGLLGKFRNKSPKAKLKNALMVIPVPIFDEDIKDLLMKKFQNEEAIAKYAKNLVEGSVKPYLAKKKQLQEQLERELHAMFTNGQSPDLSM